MDKSKKNIEKSKKNIEKEKKNGKIILEVSKK